jgi:hypothetical protein
MFIKGIAFKLELNFFEEDKSEYAIFLRDARQSGYSPAPNALVGKADYTNRFPLSYEIGAAIRFDNRRRRVCEEIIHNAIAVWIPLELSRRAVDTIHFTPLFPAYVGPHSRWYREVLASNVY